MNHTTTQLHTVETEETVRIIQTRRNAKIWKNYSEKNDQQNFIGRRKIVFLRFFT
jgi:hypothetical protein